MNLKELLDYSEGHVINNRLTDTAGKIYGYNLSGIDLGDDTKRIHKKSETNGFISLSGTTYDPTPGDIIGAMYISDSNWINYVNEHARGFLSADAIGYVVNYYNPNPGLILKGKFGLSGEVGGYNTGGSKKGWSTGHTAATGAVTALEALALLNIWNPLGWITLAALHLISLYSVVNMWSAYNMNALGIGLTIVFPFLGGFLKAGRPTYNTESGVGFMGVQYYIKPYTSGGRNYVSYGLYFNKDESLNYYPHYNVKGSNNLGGNIFGTIAEGGSATYKLASHFFVQTVRVKLGPFKVGSITYRGFSEISLVITSTVSSGMRGVSLSLKPNAWGDISRVISQPMVIPVSNPSDKLSTSLMYGLIPLTGDEVTDAQLMDSYTNDNYFESSMQAGSYCYVAHDPLDAVNDKHLDGIYNNTIGTYPGSDSGDTV